LPDSLLGAAWPMMHKALGAPLSAAGLITMIISLGTVVSALFSDRLTRKLGAGLVTALSVATTAIALYGFSTARALWVLCLWSVPYGLGAGAIDAALNNYVALHYSARHMNWLHAFWGVGVSISPYIMGFCLGRQLGWERGFSSVSLIQVGITLLLFLSLPLWKKKTASADTEAGKPLTFWQALGLRGAKTTLLSIFAYCAMEATAGLWASSYMAEYRGVAPQVAARFAALFYLGITAGRFLSGLIADRLGDRKMIRLGIALMLAGGGMILLPWQPISLAGLIVAGLGGAPVYPSIIHSTPERFGAEYSQALVGIQMAGAYMGMVLMPPLFGLIAQHISLGLYPIYLLLFTLILFTCQSVRPRGPGRAGSSAD
jgi:fucose permease